MNECKEGCKKDCAGYVVERQSVPLAMVELHSAAQERTIRRLWIIIIILIGLLCATNFAWLMYEAQFEEVSTSIEAEQETADGGNNYVIGGDFAYGETESQSDC